MIDILNQSNYVEIKGNKCYFKYDLPIRVDTVEFQETIKQAKNLWGGVKRNLYLWKANELYLGELLPANASDMWFFKKVHFLRNCISGLWRNWRESLKEQGLQKQTAAL